MSTKEAKLAELEAASSGEVVRLGASLEAAKGEVSRLEQEHVRCHLSLSEINLRMKFRSPTVSESLVANIFLCLVFHDTFVEQGTMNTCEFKR